jgi:hypothetical protein
VDDLSTTGKPWWVAARISLQAACGFLIALGLGASSASAAKAFAWGLVTFGGALALIWLIALAYLLWREVRSAGRDEELEETVRPSGVWPATFGRYLLESWRESALPLGAFVALGLVEAEGAAWGAGVLMGGIVITLPVFVGVTSIVFRALERRGLIR